MQAYMGCSEREIKTVLCALEKFKHVQLDPYIKKCVDS